MIFAYLFGSQAKGKTHPRSDVEVAVYVEDSVPQDRYLDLRLKLPAGLERARVGNVEVLVLNEAPLPLKGRVVRERKILYSRDRGSEGRVRDSWARRFSRFRDPCSPSG